MGILNSNQYDDQNRLYRYPITFIKINDENNEVFNSINYVIYYI